MNSESRKLELSRPTLELIRVARDIAERDLKLGLVTEAQMRYSIRARKEVVKELSHQGMNNYEIAKELDVSESTIRRDLEKKKKWKSTDSAKGRKNAAKGREPVTCTDDCNYDPDEDVAGEPAHVTRKRGNMWMAKESTVYAEKINSYYLKNLQEIDNDILATTQDAADAWSATVRTLKQRQNLKVVK